MSGGSSQPTVRRLGRVAAAILIAAGGGWPGGAAGAARDATATHPAPALRQVSYRGYRFDVPDSWPVIGVSRRWKACVRFDLHAIYLGQPGANQACPSWLAGATEALSVQPAAATARRGTVENQVAHQITATAPRIKITATFDRDPALIYRILASAGLAAPVVVPADPAGVADAVSASHEATAPAPVASAAVPWLPASVANRTGLGFDACATPSARFMSAWLRHSPYRAVGIYIGGADRSCDQQNLTVGWVRREAAAGWGFIPMYVGPQACLGQLTNPVRQGTEAAADAVQQAQRLTFGPQTPIYYDMEAYRRSASGRALQFLSAWTLELHRLGYVSGVYSGSSAGVADLAREYLSPRFVHPDVIDDALWNGAQNASDPVYRPGDWPGQRRLHQFSGNVLQTFGGDTMDIDQDYLDVGLTAAGGTTEAGAGTTQGNGVTRLFYRGSRNSLWEATRTATGSWLRIDLGGELSTAPSVVQVGKSGLAVLYRDRAGHLTVVRRSGGRWLAPQVLAMMGVLGGAPRAVAQANGVIDVFWSGNYDRHLWHGEFNPGRGWSGPQRLQGRLASWPEPVESASGVVQVLWEGTDGKLWRVVRGVGAAWTRPQPFAMARRGGPPHAVQLASGETDIFWRDKITHSIWYTQISPGQRVSRPRNLGGQVSGAPWPVLAAGAESVLFRGPHGQLWQVPRARRGWGAPRRVATIDGLTSAPFAASRGGAALQLFWTGPGSRLWTARLIPGQGFGAAVDLGALVRDPQ